MGRRRNVARVRLIDDDQHPEVGEPLQEILQAAGQPDAKQPADVLPVRPQTMQMQPNAPAAVQQHNELHDPADDVGDDRTDRDPLNPICGNSCVP